MGNFTADSPPKRKKMGAAARTLRVFAGQLSRRSSACVADPPALEEEALPPPTLAPPPAADEAAVTPASDREAGCPPSTSSATSPSGACWEVATHLPGFGDAVELLLHCDAHEDGGLGLTDRRLLENQRAAIFEMLKDLGRNLIMGNLNLLAVSMPVRMFEPRSYLQKLADVWVYPAYLASAAERACPPALRLQLVATWFVAGLQHVYQSWRKPFNPILGETWAASLGDGTAIFVEQVSHHPPVSAFEMVGPGGAYTFAGTSQPDVAYKGADVRTTAKGTRRLTFAADAGTGRGAISIAYPHYWMRGVIGAGLPRGEMVGVATLTYEGAGLACELAFGRSPHPEDKGEPLLQRADTVTGCVFRTTADAATPTSATAAATTTVSGRAGAQFAASGRGTKGSRTSLSAFAAALSGGGGGGTASACATPPPCRGGEDAILATCKGNWLSHLDWGRERAWTLMADPPAEWVPQATESTTTAAAGPAVLPSDAGLREDLALLAAATPTDGSFSFDPAAVASSQKAKEALELRQRAEAKLRKEGRAAAGLKD